MLEVGVPERASVHLARWANGEMLRRYVGRLSVPVLKRYPTTLAKYAVGCGRATSPRVSDVGQWFRASNGFGGLRDH